MIDLTPANHTYPQVLTALARLEAWLETMRGPAGYGGPVAHWWQQSLLYGGPGLDWRYEGIITGYLELWQRTGQAVWLEKARQAGDDLVKGQLANSHYPASAFEINPACGGTPHEAACDSALLQLARVLRQNGQAGWQEYAACAERNLRQYYLAQLWDAEAQAFRDAPGVPSFVPNKAAVLCEALFAQAELTGDEEWATRYALPTLERLLEHQLGREAGQLAGAVAQNSFGRRRVEKYFPLYNARCVPALLQAYEWSKQERYLAAAGQILGFITAWVYPDGSLPTVVYPNGTVNRWPAWVAGLGDVLRAAYLLKPYGFESDLAATEAYLLAGQDESGGIQTGRGFAQQVSWWQRSKNAGLPDLRDLLHVTGWCDKAFRYLATQYRGESWPVVTLAPFEAECRLLGQPLRLRETTGVIEVYDRQNRRVYHWSKGVDQAWASVTNSKFWLR